MTTVSVAASEEPLLILASSCSSSVAAVTEELEEPSLRHSQVEQSSKSASEIHTEESSNSNATSKSDDSSLLAVFDNSFTFYDHWNHEVQVLRAALDEKISVLAEQSQQEIERIAARMTGYQSPSMKRQSAASKYIIAYQGPKVPSHQRKARETNVNRKTFDDRVSRGTVPPSSTDAPLERVLSQLSSSQVIIAPSPSGRSQATGTSDKTVPQSNLSKHKQKKQPTSIRQVMSIPEESSLPNESDGGEDPRPHSEDNGSNIMSPSAEEVEEDMDECDPNDDYRMLQPSYHSSDDGYMDDYASTEFREGRIRGLTIITSHSEFLGDDDSKPMMISIPSLPLSSTSFPTYASKFSPSPQTTSPPKPFYRFFDTIRELRSTRKHRPWYQMSRDAPIMKSPRPDAPSEEQQKEVERTVQVDTEPGTSIESSSKVESISTADAVLVNDAVVTKSRSAISSSRSPTSLLSDVPLIMSQSEAGFVDPQPTAQAKPKPLSLPSSPECSATVPVISKKVAAPPPKRRKPPPLPEVLQRRPRERRSPKLNPVEMVVTTVESPTIVEEKQNPDTSTADDRVTDKNDDNDIAAPCLDVVVYNQERKIVPHRGTMDSSVLLMEYVTDLVIQDPYSDEGTYTGILVRRKPDSYGTMVYKDGRTYSGSWKRGRWEGYGKTTFANGDSYAGHYIQDQRHGVGRYEWADGRVYDGRFEKDQREGRGTYSWPNGSVYCGEFHCGLRHGYGTYTYENGSIYNGQWQNGKQHGTGECLWADGRCLFGEWLDGHAHFGIEVRANGTIRHNGEWSKDRPIRRSKYRKEERTSGSNELGTSNGC
jgi:hypothetical protein